MADAHLRVLIEDDLYDRVLDAHTSCDEGLPCTSGAVESDHGGPSTEASASRPPMSACRGTPREGAIRGTAARAVELFAELELAGDGTTS